MLNVQGSSVKQPSVLRPIAVAVALALAVMAARPRADVLPTAPNVIAGSASVTQTATQQTINQYSDKAIINWGSFSIGSNAGVTFVQPSASSVVLNRVVGNDPSNLLGSMSANGQVFLVNPNGVFFGVGSRIDVGGLVATSMSIADNDFLNGYYSFTRGGAGSVENAGTITIRDGGYALLAADSVRNAASGQIHAPNGSVMLASADRVTIETKPDGLVGFSVQGDALRAVARVDNAGVISADGGQIALSARGARELTGMVVNNTGVLRASSIEERDGVVILSASSGVTQSTGDIQASGARGGLIEVTNASGTAAVAGSAIARGMDGAGGRIVVAGVQTGLMDGATVDASGAIGGTVRVGGEYRGGEITSKDGQNVVSDYTYVAGSASIRADGTAGQGGSAVVWANNSTRFDGSISATGAGTGRGGDAEVSGKEYLAFNGTADLRSESGARGTLLLDPSQITIINAPATTPPDPPAGSLDGELGPADGIINAATPGGDGSTISSGKLQQISANTDVLLEATNQITLGNFGGGTMQFTQDGGADGGHVTLRTTAAGSSIVFANAADTMATSGGDLTLISEGSIAVGRLDSNGGNVNLNASTSISTGRVESNNGSVTMSAGTVSAGEIVAGNGNIALGATTSITTGAVETNNTLSYSGNNTASVTQTGRIKAGEVSITNAPAVTLTNTNNEVDRITASMNGGSLQFRSNNDLTVNNVTVNGSSASVNIASNNKLTVSGAVAATSSNAATVVLNGGHDVQVNGNVSATASNGGAGISISGRQVTTTGGLSASATNGTAAVTVVSTHDLSVGGVTATSATGAEINIGNWDSDKVTLTGGLTATGSATGSAAVNVLANNGIVASGVNIVATGGGGAGAKAASVSLKATGGNISHTGMLRAIDQGGVIAAAQTTHYGLVDVEATQGSASVGSINVQSQDGRGQVNLGGKHGVSVASGSGIVVSAASQPGVLINAALGDGGNGDLNLTGANIQVTQTKERQVVGDDGSISYVDVNKTVENAGGIGVYGRNVVVDSLTLNTSVARAGATPLYGIGITADNNITINGLVSSYSQSGIAVNTNGDGWVKTEGVGLLRGNQLALAGDRDEGYFRVKTDVSSLSILGGRIADVDNSSHGAGQLRVVLAGALTDETTNPYNGEVVPAVTKPVGALRITSQNIYIQALDNRSNNSYLIDGTRTDNVVGTDPRQDLIFIADKIEASPNSLFTKADTYAQFRPLDTNRGIQVAYAMPGTPDPSLTYYIGGPSGILNMLNPDATVVIGGDGYNGNINIGTLNNNPDQMSLGKMDLYFITAARVYNYLNSSGSAPSYWTTGVGTSAPYQVPVSAIPCVQGVACLPRMTTGKIYIRDSYNMGTNDNPQYRNVIINGSGSGTGGTLPPVITGSGDDGGGGNDNGGGGPSTPGNSGNGSEPGGPNAPPEGPPGGGNAENTDPGGEGTTTVVNNPTQSTGNPNGQPGNQPNPSDPPDTTGQTPDNTSNDDDPVESGGVFTGNPNDPDGPIISNPTPDDPDPDGPILSEPNPTDPDPDGPVITNPNPTDPEPDGPILSEPNPTDPNPDGPDITNPNPADPDPDGPVLSDPNPTDPNPDGPDVTNPTPSDPQGPDVTGPAPSDPDDPTDPNPGPILSGDPTPPGDTPGDNDPPTQTGNPNNPTTPAPGANPSDPADPTDPDPGPDFSGDPGAPTDPADPGTPTGGNNNPGNSTPGDNTGNTPGTTTGSTPGNTNTTDNNNDGFTGGATPGNNPSNPNAPGDSADGGVFAGNDPLPGDSTNTADSGTPGSNANMGNNDTGSSGSNDGSGSGSSGTNTNTGSTDVAGNNSNDGGFTGGGSGDASSGSTPGAGSSSDGGSIADSGSQNNQGSGSQSGNQQSGNQQGGSGSGSSSSSGSSEFAGGASGGAAGANDDDGSSSTASSGGSGSGGSNNAGGGQQQGGSQQQASSGQGSGNAGGQSSSQASSTESTRIEPPPCEDESQSTRNVTRAGQPNSDLIQLRGSGTRLRPAEGSLAQQRISCASKVSQK